MGFCSESVRFEGGGRNIRLGIGFDFEENGWSLERTFH